MTVIRKDSPEDWKELSPSTISLRSHTMLKQVLCLALVALAAAQNVDEQCGTCVVDGGPLTENGAVGYTYDPNDCGAYWVCIRRSERGDDGWMYDVFTRDCAPGTLWLQKIQACSRCDSEDVTCENSGPKPPLGSEQCPEQPPPKSTLPPLPPVEQLDQNCTDDAGLMKSSVIGEASKFFIHYPNHDPLGPVSCEPYNFSLSLCRCNAPEYDGVNFGFEGSFHAAGNIAVCLPNARRSVYFVNESRVGDQSVYLDGMGHIECPLFKQNSPRAPFSVALWVYVDPIVSDQRKVALVNNAKCNIAPTFELSVQGGVVEVNIVTDNGTFSASGQLGGAYQGEWHQYRASYNGAILSLDLDGSMASEVPADGDLLSNEAAWVVGLNCYQDTQQGAPTSSLTGNVDQLEISFKEYIRP
ncbi:uncharacterized protein LOC106164848 [Lingula anatina]|uniref:Uncharacterized protein LOC106164848 n=1 Tax=Lingula anatina TaxID=7574 RepID=A0A1S3IJB6_LINAN|nr:uncharacterized protein LOC106164848 [Lingula anatina]|eukprot:XP_013398335.1 uncharacterized protein LOC106164848 [Lingula anatina]